MITPLRLGLAGLDSSHAPAFTRLLNATAEDSPHREPGGVQSTQPPHPALAGARVVAAWPGTPSADFAMSRDRFDDVSHQVLDDLAIPQTSSLADLLDHVDAVLITAVDPRQHVSLLAAAVDAGRPAFVDTRLTLSAEEVEPVLAEANARGVPVLCASPKRYASAFTDAQGPGAVVGVDLWGPMPAQPPLPLPAWYGVHLADLAHAALGPGCVSVTARSGPNATVLVCQWEDGRIATLRGSPTWTPHTGGRLHRTESAAAFQITVGGPDFYVPLLAEILTMCRTSRAPIATAEMLGVVRLLTAAAESLQTGAEVRV
ncbi:Gfo/Idh/MocA family protein [Ruania rhizosphaerae]|uniref:Gfo/Idh/MocA family protein n=1 Tax=Ruania rhizosphaerae TaxID=1840413 RepID=UPI001356E26C|nr:gfo/Idh/MocA family oxidoreductase [Ruania rhizosphaerae]